MPETSTGSIGEAFSAIATRRLSRRGFMAGAAGVALMMTGCERLFGEAEKSETAGAAGSSSPETGARVLTFKDLPQTLSRDQAIADGYKASPLIRWGDAVLANAPAFDPAAPSAEAQAAQFGFNNDFIGYLPLPRGSQSSDHGLLWVNHEYALVESMFAKDAAGERSPAHTAIEKAAHGGSVIEVKRENGAWRVVENSPYARRVTVETAFAISGPCAGHERLKTSGDPSGTLAYGTVNNCAGGVTPWGTVLSGEENFNGYFGGALPAGSKEGGYDDRLGIRETATYPWFRDDPRFDRSKEPNEKNRFGWVVEIDPYEPQAQPVKRTALGRFKHEGATSVIAPDGRVVVYMGDDQANEYIYRFVSAKVYDPSKPGMGQGLLDEGTLSVAVFDEKRVTWVPLVFGQGKLTAENGFVSQADILIDTRRAAELLGATPMDRPEDIETNPVNGRVYAVMTGNPNRTEGDIHPANPRNWNTYGHVIEMIPPGSAEGKADHAADSFAWDILLLAGRAANPAQFPETPRWSARYGAGTQVAMLNPDNCAFDPFGRIWFATDQVLDQELTGVPDGLFACAVDGAERAVVKFFYACPLHAELCGPCFTPDGTTLFVSVQHPAQDEKIKPDETYWPDFKAGMPPRPAVVVITRADGGPVGG